MSQQNMGIQELELPEIEQIAGGFSLNGLVLNTFALGGDALKATVSVAAFGLGILINPIIGTLTLPISGTKLAFSLAGTGASALLHGINIIQSVLPSGSSTTATSK